jgi:hypothetical protein
MNRYHVLGLALAAALPLGSVAAVPGGAQYDLRFTMRVGDAAPTHPRLRVLEGETATVMIANEGYSLHLTAVPDISRNVAVAAHVSTWTPQGLANQDGHASVAANGESGTLTFRGTDPATGSGRDISITFSARPLTH